MMVKLIDDFFAEYPPATGRSDKVDTDESDEVIDAVAKKSQQQDGVIRQQVIEPAKHAL
jgi:hypothetical protein